MPNTHHTDKNGYASETHQKLCVNCVHSEYCSIPMELKSFPCRDFERRERAFDRKERENDAPPAKAWFEAILSEWRWSGAILAPFGVAIALYFIPATKGELDALKNDTASNFTLTKTDIAGQLTAARIERNGQISVLTTRIDGMQTALDRTERGVDELLRRSEPRPIVVDRSETQSEQTQELPSTPNHHPSRKTPKAKKKQESGLGLWLR